MMFFGVLFQGLPRAVKKFLEKFAFSMPQLSVGNFLKTLHQVLGMAHWLQIVIFSIVT
jgi:hypothetical protein